jgi:Holliday junction resolvase RusA-like endonuclease
VKAKAAKAYRKAAGWATIEAREVVEDDGPIDVHLTFYPPDNRRYDGDNLLARMKSGLDGLADALKVDDSKFDISYNIVTPCKNGKVEVKIMESPNGTQEK